MGNGLFSSSEKSISYTWVREVRDAPGSRGLQGEALLPTGNATELLCRCELPFNAISSKSLIELMTSLLMSLLSGSLSSHPIKSGFYEDVE